MEPKAVLERAAWLVRSQSKRVKLQEELQSLFELDWNDDVLKNKPDWVKEIKDPQVFNAMQALVDVMAHDEPIVNIEVPKGAMPTSIEPSLPQDPMAQMQAEMGIQAQATDNSAAEMGDLLENVVQEVFRENDRNMPTSLQRDNLYSGFVMGMIVEKAGDLRLGQRWNKYQQKNRGRSPFRIKPVSPAHIYYEYDDYGLCEVYHRYLRPLKEIKYLYGNSVPELVSVKAEAADGFVLFSEYWRHDVMAKWVERVYTDAYMDSNFVRPNSNETVTSAYFLEKPKPNPLEFIPYSLKIARGTNVFSQTARIYPHLYAGHQSKLFLRQNLFMTVASTLAFMLVNPQHVQETDEPEKPIELDFSQPAVHGIRKGDKLSPVDMKITRDFYEVMTMFAQKMEESTISKVVYGQSPGGVTAAAGINQLMQGGKLTVSGVQKAMGEVREGTIQNVFDYVKAYANFAEAGEKAELDLYISKAFQTIDPANFPERLNISVRYDPFLPQDKALAVQTWLTPLMQELISSDFFYEQTGVRDVITLRRQIESDKDRKLADQQFQQQVAMAQQEQQAAAQQPPQGQPTGEEPTETVGEQALEQPTPNPMPDEANPADLLNQMQNSIENPMSV